VKEKKMKPKPAFDRGTAVAAPPAMSGKGGKKSGKGVGKKSGKPYGHENRQVSGHLNPTDLRKVSGGGPSMPPMGKGTGKRKKKASA
jgi:hypothetical protein